MLAFKSFNRYLDKHLMCCATAQEIDANKTNVIQALTETEFEHLWYAV